MRQNKAFSLIELVFSLLIIAIITLTALPYFKSNQLGTQIKILKNELLLIQNSINQFKNTMTTNNTNEALNNLEDDENILFSKILQTKPNPSWEKIDTNIYRFSLQNNLFLDFTYDYTSGIFMCDKSLELCREVLR